MKQAKLLDDQEFQSTRPQGARHRTSRVKRLIYCFNPRARRGRDLTSIQLHKRHQQFQSTRPQGARPAMNAKNVELLDVSIHAPAGGATWT